ncbi:nitrilase-related carbon-nitrogen hydrolase [Aquimarina agarivorans]|uniref:nitrilase-related carbon-nitrogen hydrolase n=1 Tax=Aquimarina agarivorans TaxID=980584 RepID=UPI0002DBC274|nr:nitrilase-related carbon-nitrogen hydrolase [Aquimarina agarivorans]
MGSVMISENGAIYNRMLLVTPSGEIQYYDKRHLFAYANEDKHFKKGTTNTIFKLAGWKIKPIICYDLRFPVAARNIEDYDLLICVANWPNTRIEAWDTLLKARSIENLCYTIGVNRTGADANNLKYIGHSNCYDPLGKRLLPVYENQDVISVVIDKNKVQNIREKLPFLADRDHFKIY